ncbi:MAG: hypothetical protein IT299_13255 [Dehalococcoidia bacterium]|nr:hypothetical protein [Dehalococcoidia bacterium]
MSRGRLAQGAIVLALVGSFGVALYRSEDASVRIPSKEEFRLKSFAEWPREPASLAEFLDVGSHLGVPRTVAIVTVGPISGQRAEERAPQTGPTPAPMGRGPTTDYEVHIDEVLAPSGLRAGERVTLRYGGPPDPDYFVPFPHPVPGQRLLLVLVPDPVDAAHGVYQSYAYGRADITGANAHLADAWRTSVAVMGVPASTPAFIEAVRSALRTP